MKNLHEGDGSEMAPEPGPAGRDVTLAEDPHTGAATPTWRGLDAWRRELLFALPVVALVVYLFYTWFAVLDRYAIFLYFHDMGPEFDTTPFGRATVGRYWMSGLVASGAVLVPYSAINLFLGRCVKSYRAPTWWRLWILCAAPLSIAIPVIVMTVNDPVLPLVNAVQVSAALLVSLALAVSLGQYAAARPVTYVLLMIDGAGLAGILTSLRAAEHVVRGSSSISSAMAYRIVAVLAASLGLITVLTVTYCLCRRTWMAGALPWLTAGASIHYLFLPLYHHLCWCKDDGSWRDPDYFAYVPSADNYFPGSILFQIAIWAIVALVAVGITRVRLRLRTSEAQAVGSRSRGLVEP